MRSFFASVVFLAVVGCAHSGATGTEVLESAARDATSHNANQRTLALAGFHALLMKNDPVAAKAHFDEALERGAGEPYALFGEALLAQRASNQALGLQAALDLCERAPTHPLSAAGARLAFDLAGRSKTFDDAIVERGTKILGSTQLRGDAASLLRGALATVYLARGDGAKRDQVLRDMGVPTEWALMGPFSAFHLLDLEKPTPVESNGVLAASTGPFGVVSVRTLRTADGRLSLAPEPPQGDVFVLAADVTLAEGGEYVVRAVTSMDHAMIIDGEQIALRRTWETTASTVTERAVKLRAGKHRLLLRVARDEQQGALFVNMSRTDGRPAGVTSDCGDWSPVELGALGQQRCGGAPRLLPRRGLDARRAGGRSGRRPGLAAGGARLALARSRRRQSDAGDVARRFRRGHPALSLGRAQLL